jgi:hypothetical protein
MTSRLEQAIECGVLPEKIHVLDYMDLQVRVQNKGYKLVYAADDYCYESLYESKTLDEAVDTFVSMFWSKVKTFGFYTYEVYCLELAYKPMFYPKPNELSIAELGITIKIDFKKDDKEERLQFIDELRIRRIKELCANKDTIPLPKPFNEIKY